MDDDVLCNAYQGVGEVTQKKNNVDADATQIQTPHHDQSPSCQIIHSDDEGRTAELIASESLTPVSTAPVTMTTVSTLTPSQCRKQMSKEDQDKQDQLKNVLMAFANHNPTVGYCQGSP